MVHGALLLSRPFSFQKHFTRMRKVFGKSIEYKLVG